MVIKVSPEEVHDLLYKEELSISEIARRLKISRTSVRLKLREFDLDNFKRELNEEKADLEARKIKVEAREKEINKLRDLEERVHLLESKVHLLNSEVDSLTKERNEQDEAIRNNKEVLEEIKEYKGRREEARNELTELKKSIVEGKSILSNTIDLQKRSSQTLEETKNQINIESLKLYRLKQEINKNGKENARLSEENKHLKEENRVKKEAINEIKQSYYGFLESTKQIALYMRVGSATKEKTHEELRKKVLQGMKIIAENAKIT